MLNLRLFLIPGLIFIFTAGMGFVVLAAGRPYNTFLFNVHKLAALAGVVLAVVRLVGSGTFDDPSLGRFLPLALAAVGLISLFATGALLSIQKDLKRVVQFIHRLSAVLILLAAGTWICLT
jgi:hypothetical protein